MTDTTTEPAMTATEKKSSRRQALDKFEGTRTVFELFPEDVVVDGVDNDAEIDDYNASRLKEKIQDEDVMSIIRFGVMKPIEVVVEKVGEEKIPHATEGRQRTLRCRIANEWIDLHNDGAKILPEFAGKVLERRVLTCLTVRRASDLEMIQRSMAANSGVLADSPKRLAMAANYLQSLGSTTQEIAVSLGKNDETIRGYLALGGASSKLLKLLDDGGIKLTAASRLAELTKDEQNEAIEKLVAAAPSGVVTKEAAVGAAKRGKAAAKGKESAQESARLSVKDLRTLQAGLQSAGEIALLTAINFVLGEKTPSGGGEWAKALRAAMAGKSGVTVKE